LFFLNIKEKNERQGSGRGVKGGGKIMGRVSGAEILSPNYLDKGKREFIRRAEQLLHRVKDAKVRGRKA